MNKHKWRAVRELLLVAIDLGAWLIIQHLNHPWYHLNSCCNLNEPHPFIIQLISNVMSPFHLHFQVLPTLSCGRRTNLLVLNFNSCHLNTASTLPQHCPNTASTLPQHYLLYKNNVIQNPIWQNKIQHAFDIMWKEMLPYCFYRLCQPCIWEKAVKLLFFILSTSNIILLSLLVSCSKWQINLSICPSVRLSIYPSVCPSVCVSIRLSVYSEQPGGQKKLIRENWVLIFGEKHWMALKSSWMCKQMTCLFDIYLHNSALQHSRWKLSFLPPRESSIVADSYSQILPLVNLEWKQWFQL